MQLCFVIAECRFDFYLFQDSFFQAIQLKQKAYHLLIQSLLVPIFWLLVLPSFSRMGKIIAPRELKFEYKTELFGIEERWQLANKS